MNLESTAVQAARSHPGLGTVANFGSEQNSLSEFGVHGVSPEEPDTVSDTTSRSMSVDSICRYEGGRTAFVDVNWDGP